MKKWIAFLMALAMLMSFSACAGNKRILPKELITDDGTKADIVFSENTYTLQIGTNTVEGIYTAARYSDNCVAVVCEIKADHIDDGNEHVADAFYLFSSDMTTWKYYGENYFDLAPGTDFVQADGCKRIPVETVQEHASAKVDGYYESGDMAFDKLTVKRALPEGRLVFDVEWYRTSSICDCIAGVYGDYAAFCYAGLYASEETWGVIKFSDDRASLTLFTSELPYTDIGTYQYDFLSIEEILQRMENTAKSDLTQNDDTRGWKKDDEHTYLRFHPDGTVDCWIGHFPVLEMPIDKYTWNYKIEGNKIRIGDYEYKYTSLIGSGAAIAYRFSAIGDDPYLLSGEFALSDAGIYPMLAAGQYGLVEH